VNAREVDALLSKLSGAYQLAVIDDAVREAYREGLSDVRAADVGRAALAHMRSSPRFPTIAELRGRVEAVAPRPGPPDDIPPLLRATQPEVRVAVAGLLAKWHQRKQEAEARRHDRVPGEDDE
jgi:hypothetical protein